LPGWAFNIRFVSEIPFFQPSLLNNKKAPGFGRGLISAPHLAGS
jgi:hypothetical protein